MPLPPDPDLRPDDDTVQRPADDTRSADDGGAEAVRDAQAHAPCQLGPTATDTSERLKKLRELMAQENVAAYIIPSDDEHGVRLRFALKQNWYARPAQKEKALV